MSPTPSDTERPCSARNPRPVAASATASQTVARMCSRNRPAPKIGVATTYIPVTNPETLADVWERPTVCSTWAVP